MLSMKSILSVIIAILTVFSIALIIAIAIIITRRSCSSKNEMNSLHLHPFFISLIIRSHDNILDINNVFAEDRYLCGSSMIGHYWSITAAHCIKFIEKYNISKENWFIKSRIMKERNIDKYYIHEKYEVIDEANYDYDIALIKIKQPFSKSSYKSIPLAGKHYNYISDQDCTVIGLSEPLKIWKSLHQFQENPVQTAVIKIMNQTRCKEIYKNSSHDQKDEISNRMVCGHWYTNNNTICQFDFGGALIQNNILIGITSWLIECENERYPKVFTKIGMFQTWFTEIQEKVNESIGIQFINN